MDAKGSGLMERANSTAELSVIFQQKGLRATPQRMLVYQFLKEHPIHPSAETIYQEVIKAYPNFSRTTIYNTLNVLVEKGLAISVRLDEKELRYDGNAEYHGHFRCEGCGKIADFSPTHVEYQGLEGCKVLQEDVYFSGYCTKCAVTCK